VLDRRLTWRGRDVAWSQAGSGPPVVFCHGTPWSSLLWAPFAEALSRDFSVYLWDMPGYGQSSMEAEHRVDLATQGELFVDLLGHWGLVAPHVVAHDYGGAVALRAHLLHSTDFASLFLADVVALRPWGSPFFRLVKAHAEVFRELPANVHRGALEAYVSTASHGPLSPDSLTMLVQPWLTPQGQAAFYAQIAQADERFTEDFEPHLSDVRAPVRIVWGERDTWIPVDRAGRLHDLIPGSTLVTVPSAGHLLHLDTPVVLATELWTWLAENVQSTRA
jgi:pimeloyl-ACP methyl ester carboxylesterase